MFDLARYKFVVSLDSKLPYFKKFFVMLELQYHLIDGLLTRYGASDNTHFVLQSMSISVFMQIVEYRPM